MNSGLHYLQREEQTLGKAQSRDLVSFEFERKLYEF